MSDKFDEAMAALRLASRMSLEFYGNPMTVCYSGGKDSDALLKLALESGEPFRVFHNHTTADAPETVMYVRRRFRELEERGVETSIIYPSYQGAPITMWSLIPKKLMPPTRLVRYCCSVLKEHPITDSVALFGIRASESRQRSTRSHFELIGRTKKQGQGWDLDAASEVFEESRSLPEVFDCNLISGMKGRRQSASNPILSWTDRDVYDYLAGDDLNPLYEEGFARVGCIGCPMAARARYREFARWPKYRRAYVRAFDKMLSARRARGKQTEWRSGEEVFSWWMEEKVVKGQMRLDLEGGSAR